MFYDIMLYIIFFLCFLYQRETLWKNLSTITLSLIMVIKNINIPLKIIKSQSKVMEEAVMLDIIPNTEQMTTLVGESLFEIWNQLCALIDEKYDMDCLWNKGGKAWTYEYKYRRGGKTLCTLYARENCIGFMIILGKDERLKFENNRENYSEEVQRIYDETHTYHDGKWIMFEPKDTSLFDDFIKLLSIKRKPNRK